MKIKSIKKQYSGQSMFEVLVAIFIISLITVGVVVVSTNSVSNSTFSRNSTLAGRYTQEAIEWLRDEKTKDFAVFKAKIPQQTYCLDNLNWANINTCGSSEYLVGSNNVFKRELKLTSSLINGKNLVEAEVKVYWSDPKGIHEVKSITNFSDIREK